MKTTATLLIAFSCLFFSCSSDEDNEPRPKDSDIGCITAIPKDGSSDTPVFIRCATRKQFGAGSNTNIGGTSTWLNYTNHEWTQVKGCEECQQ